MVALFAYLIEPPFGFRDDDGKAVGCDLALARTVLRIARMAPLHPIEAEFADLLPGLAAGRWQMTTGLFVTEERRKVAVFSRPIWALPDGLLVRRDNPRRLTGYASAAEHRCVVAVVRDQVQQRSAIHFGIAKERLLVVDTYREGATAVEEGRADAFASVARAHTGFLIRHAVSALELVNVSPLEKKPGLGAFAFDRSADNLREKVDAALLSYLGSPQHRAMMATFGFTDAEVDLVATRGRD